MPHPDPPEPELTDEEAAEVVAFLDGRLPEHRHGAILERIEREPGFAAAIERRERASSVIAAAVAETHAPLGLRQRVDALSSAPAARAPRRRWLPFALTAGAAATVAVAVVIAVGGGELDVRSTVAAALRSPVAAIGVDPVQPRLLREEVEGVRFPNFGGKFGWQPIGERTDEIEGRRTRTVFYERAGRRIAYTIVAGDALEEPGDGRPVTVGGVRLRTLRVGDRAVVTWRRGGRTCVLSGAGVTAPQLLELAAWRGQGDVQF